MALAVMACGWAPDATSSGGHPPGAVRVFAEQPNALYEAYFSAAAVSSDGRRAVYAGFPGFTRLLDLERGRDFEGEPVPGVAGVQSAAFGPGGEWTVMGKAGDEFGWFRADEAGEVRPLPIPPDASPFWEPGGNRVAYHRMAAPDSVFVGPADSVRSHPIDGAVTGLGWLPGGAGILVLALTPSGSSTLWKLDPSTGQTEALADSLDAPWGPPPPIAVAPDGRRVFIALAGPGVPDPETRHQPQADRRLGIYQLDLATGARRTVVAPTGVGDAFAPSVAGGNLYWTYAESALSIVVLPAAGGPAKEVVKGAFVPTWHPGARRIGFAYGDWRWVDWPLNWDGGAIEVDESGDPLGPPVAVVQGYHEDFPPVWSPRGGWVAYHSHRSKEPVASYFSPVGTDDIWLRREGAPPRDPDEIRLTDFGFETDSPSWSRDGSRLVFSSWEPGGPLGVSHPYYVRIDTATGRPVDRGRLPVPAAIPGVSSAAWSPTSDDLALEQELGGRRALWVVPERGGAPRKVVDYVSRVASGWAWTADGGGLVYAAAAPDRYQLFVVPIAGGTPRQLSRDSANLMKPAMSPDGRTIAATRVTHRKEVWSIPIPR